MAALNALTAACADEFTLSIAGDVHFVMPLAAALCAALTQLGVAADDVAKVKLGVVEAVNNCIEHAYAYGGAHGRVSVGARLDDARLELRVCDTGRTPGTVPVAALPDAEQENGRGCFIVNACFDSVEYRSDGGVNTLLLVRKIGFAAPRAR